MSFVHKEESYQKKRDVAGARVAKKSRKKTCQSDKDKKRKRKRNNTRKQNINQERFDQCPLNIAELCYVHNSKVHTSD